MGCAPDGDNHTAGVADADPTLTKATRDGEGVQSARCRDVLAEDVQDEGLHLETRLGALGRRRGQRA